MLALFGLVLPHLLAPDVAVGNSANKYTKICAVRTLPVQLVSSAQLDWIIHWHNVNATASESIQFMTGNSPTVLAKCKPRDVFTATQLSCKKCLALPHHKSMLNDQFISRNY